MAPNRNVLPLIGAAAVAIALVVVHELTREISLVAIRAAIRAVSASALWSSIVFTSISYAAMALYDLLAVRRVAPGRVPARLSLFAGAVGYGFSNALGFHVFVGGPVRYRVYHAVGLDAGDVGRIVGISALTFWAGVVGTLAVALLLHPAGVSALRAIGALDDRLLGTAILAALGIAVGWLARADRKLLLFGWTFLLPSGRSALVQIVVGIVDVGASAAALYVLLPADAAPSFAAFVVVFVAAIVAGVASHAPGGLGVLEATVLLGLGAANRPDVIAALVLFRLVYYALPLVLAAVALALFEAWRVRASIGDAFLRALAITRRIVPPVAGTLAFGGGIVLLLSGNTPAIGARTSGLRDVLPLPFAEASHLLASLSGLLLIVVARGLYRRIALARVSAIALLVAGAAFSLAKGLDWEEASLLAGVALVLQVSAPAFYRKDDWRSFRPDSTGIAQIVIVLASAALIGLLAFRHVEYRADLWWEFAWRGDAPRFLRATLATAVVAAAIALDALMNRPAHAPGQARNPVPQAVRDVLVHASGAQPCVALLGDKRFLVADDGKAFLMYAASGSSWISMGDPVGDPVSGQALVWRFAEAADRAGARAVYYAVQPQWIGFYLELGLALLKIGEVARVPLAEFSLEGPERKSLRHAANRAAKEGLRFSVIPKAVVPTVLDELREVSDTWMSGKHGREKGFSLGYFDDAYLSEFDCAVMRKNDVIVAFANLWRSGDHDELSIDLMRYRPGVSKVLMDALFVQLLLQGRDEGYRWFDLGAAPLSGLADHPLASTWNRVGTLVYKRGDEFYNFEGLRAFKEKFDPVWAPQYLACPGGLAMPQVLIDVTTLISRGAGKTATAPARSAATSPSRATR